MKKLLVGLLIAAGITSVHAQSSDSSVTIYGVIDASYVNQSGKGLSANNINSSTTVPTNLGIRGSEDLGGGNKVGFDLNAGINLNSGNVGSPVGAPAGQSAHTQYQQATGTSTMFNRAANVSWNNEDVGVFKLGRQATPFFLSSFTADALSTTSGGIGIAQNLLGAGLSGNGMLSGNLRQPYSPDVNVTTPIGPTSTYNTGLGWFSKNYDGFKARAFVGLANNSSATPINSTRNGNYLNQQGMQAIGASYNDGTYIASYDFQNILDNVGHKQYSAQLATLGYVYDKLTLKATYLGATYGNCSQASAGGNCQYSLMTVGANGSITASLYNPAGTAYGDNFNSYALGASYDWTPQTRVAFQATQLNDSIRTANKATMYTLFGDYKFSKRTSVYGLASTVVNQGTASVSPIFGAPANTNPRGNTVTAVAVGLKQVF